MTLDSEPRQAEDASSEHDATELKQISRAMVRLYKDQFGRGPGSVWTRYSGPDCIISILGSSLSPVERRMRD